MTKDRQEAFSELDKQEGADEASETKEKEHEASKEEEHTVPYGKYKAERDRLNEKVTALTDANAELQTQLKKLQESPELPEDVKTKLEELEKAISEKEHTIAQMELTSTIERKLLEEGCQDTELLIKAIDLESAKLNEDGSVEGFDVDKLKSDKPYLFAKPKQVNNGADPVGGSTDSFDERMEQTLGIREE